MIQHNPTVVGARSAEYDYVYGKGAFISEVGLLPLRRGVPNQGSLSVRGAFCWLGPAMTGEPFEHGEQTTDHVPSIELDIATMAMWHDYGLGV